MIITTSRTASQKHYLIIFVISFVFLLSATNAAVTLTLPWNFQFYMDNFQNGSNSEVCKFSDVAKATLPVASDYYFCIDIPLGTKAIWIVNSSAPTFTYNIKSYNKDWQNPISKWDNDNLPPGLIGSLTTPNGSITVQNITYTFESLGDYYFRDEYFVNDMYGVFRIICFEDQLNDDRCKAESSSSDEDEGWRIYGEILSWLTLLLLWLSIGGALFTIVTFLIHREIRTYPIKLILYLCICIIIGNLSFILAFEDDFINDSLVCYLCGATVHYFFLSNFCWTLCIAFNFYQMIVKRNRESENYEKWYHLIGWGIPLGSMQFVSGFREYGFTGAACYITDPIFIFVFFFLPGLFITSINVIFFFFVAREIHETLASAPKSDKRERRKEFRVYVSIISSLGLSWIFGFLMFLFALLDLRYITLIFLTLFTFFTPLQGFLIFVFYCINAKVAGKWAGLFANCLPFCSRWENLETRGSTASGSRTGSSRTSRTSRTSGTSSGIDSTSGASADGGHDDDDDDDDDDDGDGDGGKVDMGGSSSDSGDEGHGGGGGGVSL